MFNFLKSKENQKQALLTLIAIMFIVLGTLNLNKEPKENTYASEILEVASRNVLEENLGDVELVSSTPAIVENDSLNNGVDNNNNNNNDNENNNIDNYFNETRLERDRMYSESIEIYQKILDNKETPSDQKLIATNEISRINTMKNGILISENLIKNKGIEEVVILENNGMVNVIVKSSLLNKEEISQIQNIIQRELKIEIGNISISRK